MKIIKRDLNKRIYEYIKERAKDLTLSLYGNSIDIDTKHFLFFEYLSVGKMNLSNDKEMEVRLYGDVIDKKKYNFDELSNILKSLEKEFNIKVTIEITY